MSSQGATYFAQSIERERYPGDVTNAAVVRCPNHANHRAICTSAASVSMTATCLTSIIRGFSLHPS